MSSFMVINLKHEKIPNINCDINFNNIIKTIREKNNERDILKMIVECLVFQDQVTFLSTNIFEKTYYENLSKLRLWDCFKNRWKTKNFYKYSDSILMLILILDTIVSIDDTKLESLLRDIMSESPEFNLTIQNLPPLTGEGTISDPPMHRHLIDFLKKHFKYNERSSQETHILC